MGCFHDEEPDARDMADGIDAAANVIGTQPPLGGDWDEWALQIPVEQVSTECAQLCRSHGYRYMGLQWVSYCKCANHYGSQGVSTACGDHGELCGDGTQTCGNANAVWDLARPNAAESTEIEGYEAAYIRSGMFAHDPAGAGAAGAASSSGSGSSFRVDSGPCELSQGGSCVGRPNGYGGSETCSITAMSSIAALSCPIFNTGQGYDYLTIDGTQYGGTDCPTGVSVSSGSSVSWSSDGSAAGAGWEICTAGAAAFEFAGLRRSASMSGPGWMMEGVDTTGAVMLTLGQSVPYIMAPAKAALQGPRGPVSNMELYVLADESLHKSVVPQGVFYHVDCQGTDTWQCWEEDDPYKNATTGCVQSFAGCPSRLAVATVAVENPADDECVQARWQYECLAGHSCVGSLAGGWVTADEQLAPSSVAQCTDAVYANFTCLELAQQLTVAALHGICPPAAVRNATEWAAAISERSLQYPQFAVCECLCSAVTDAANVQPVDFTFSMTQSGSLAMYREDLPKTRVYDIAPCVRDAEDQPCDAPETYLKQTGDTTVHVSGLTVRMLSPEKSGVLSVDWSAIVWDDGSVSVRADADRCTRVGPVGGVDLALTRKGAGYSHSGGSASGPVPVHMQTEPIDGIVGSTHETLVLSSGLSNFYELDLGCEADIGAVRVWGGDNCCGEESRRISVTLSSAQGTGRQHLHQRFEMAQQTLRTAAPSGYYASATFVGSRAEPSTVSCPAAANCYRCALDHTGGESICISCLAGFDLMDVDERSVGKCIPGCPEGVNAKRACELPVQASCSATTCEGLGWLVAESVSVLADGFSHQRVGMVEGVSAFHDSSATTCVGVPSALVGGMFFQSGKAGLDSGAAMFIVTASAVLNTTVYLFVTGLENGGLHTASPGSPGSGQPANHDPSKCLENGNFDNDCCGPNGNDHAGQTCGDGFVASFGDNCYGVDHDTLYCTPPMNATSLAQECAASAACMVGWTLEGAGPYLKSDARESASFSQTCVLSSDCEYSECRAESRMFPDAPDPDSLYSATCREGTCWHGYHDAGTCEGKANYVDAGVGNNLVCLDGMMVLQACVRSDYGATLMWSYQLNAREVLRVADTTARAVAGVVVQIDDVAQSHCVSPESSPPAGVTFNQAEAFCEAQGARLCKASELVHNPLDFAGRAADVSVWTASRTALQTCPTGFAVCENCCDTDHDCNCDATCAGRSPRGYQPDGDTCGTGVDCESGNCVAGSCGPDMDSCTIPRPTQTPVTCESSSSVVVEADTFFGTSAPRCVSKDDQSICATFGSQEVPMVAQCCADVRESTCQDGCEITCSNLQEDENVEDRGDQPIAVTVPSPTLFKKSLQLYVQCTC